MDNRYISMEDFAKSYLFHAKMKAQAELNQIFREIKKYDADDIVNIETYTKADMVAMLTEIQLEIEELKSYESVDGQDLVMFADIGILFQQKINALKGENTNE